MMNSFKRVFMSALVILVIYQLTACGRTGNNTVVDEEPVNDRPVVLDEIAVNDTSADLEEEAAEDSPVMIDEEAANDRPTIPEDATKGMKHLYDFRFSEKYDERITGDFSFIFADIASPIGDTLHLFDKYQNEMKDANESLYHGDGMVPHMYKRYWLNFEQGNLMIGTDYYEPDHAEYISYLWSDIEGVRTNKEVAVGSTERELLSAYTDNLFYLGKGEAVLNISEIDETMDVDFAYFWQPFTHETNETRDITFYIKDGKVVALEMVQPYELRYVYGYDYDAGLQYTEERRQMNND